MPINSFSYRSFLVSSAFLLAAISGASSDDTDQELARRLLQEGRILPLAEIVGAVRAEVPGEILEVEFDTESAIYVYKLTMLKPDGKLQEVEVDAATGKVVKIEDED